MRVPTISRLGTLLKRIVLAVAAVQGATLLGLVAVDYRRKRLRKPATFPRLPPSSVTVGGSEVTVYTYGEDLYRDMLNAISQAKSRIFFESFIWKADAVGQAFKDALIEAANRGVKVYIVFDEFANLVVPPSFFVFPKNVAVRRHPLVASGLRFPRNTGRDHRNSWSSTTSSRSSAVTTSGASTPPTGVIPMPGSLATSCGTCRTPSLTSGICGLGDVAPHCPISAALRGSRTFGSIGTCRATWSIPFAGCI